MEPLEAPLIDRKPGEAEKEVADTVPGDHPEGDAEADPEEGISREFRQAAPPGPGVSRHIHQWHRCGEHEALVPQPLLPKDGRDAGQGQKEGRDHRAPPEQREHPDIPRDVRAGRQALVEPRDRVPLVAGEEPIGEVGIEVGFPRRRGAVDGRVVVGRGHQGEQVGDQPVTGDGGRHDAHGQDRVPLGRGKHDSCPARDGRAADDHQHEDDEHRHRDVRVGHQRALVVVRDVDADHIYRDDCDQTEQDGSSRQPTTRGRLRVQDRRVAGSDFLCGCCQVNAFVKRWG